MAIEVHEPTTAEQTEWVARLDAYVHRAHEAADALAKAAFSDPSIRTSRASRWCARLSSCSRWRSDGPAAP
jgi:hypothetical protein